MNLTIREADLSDRADCADIVDVLNSYAADPIGGGIPLSAEVRARLPLGLREHPTTLVLLARVEGKSIGVAVCFWGFSTFHAHPLLNIHDLAVTPEWRGKGVGTALLDAIEARALERGCCKLTLEVQDDNRRARALYDRCGFGDAVVGSARPTRFLCKLLPGSRVDMARVIQAGAIAMRGKKVLIVRAKKNPRDWIFPKGHVEPGESLAETACRELAEEAGIAGKAVQEVGVSTFQRGRLLIEVTYFLVRFVGRVEPAEQREVRWCSLDKARTLLSFADAQRLLDRVEELC